MKSILKGLSLKQVFFFGRRESDFDNIHDGVICNIAIYADDVLSTLSVIRHLIYGNNYYWLLNLNLIYKTLCAGVGSGLLISMLEKLVSCDQTNNTGIIDVEIDGSVLDEK